MLSTIFILASLNILFVHSYDVKTLYTHGYSYSQFFPLEENLTPDRTLRFSVLASRDAQILLAPTHEADQPVYEIVLGARNNTMNHIRGRCPCQEEPSATVRTVNLLSAREFRNFWIRVGTDRQKTAVQVGLGDSDTPFHEWRDPRPLKPMFLSFRSATPATWMYGFRDENYDAGISVDRRQSTVTSTGFGQYFPLSEHASHSEDGVTLYFTVRTSRELQILLSPEISTLGDVYLIGVRANGAYIRRRQYGDNSAAFQQPGFLSDHERQSFWIKLSRGSNCTIKFSTDGTIEIYMFADGMVMLGKGAGTSSPVLQWKDPTAIYPQYLSFLVNHETNEDPDSSVYADVQYGLGPDYTISSQDCTARWKESNGHLPAGAVRGGLRPESTAETYVCRAEHEGDTIPGSYIADSNGFEGKCRISQNFSVYGKTQFEVLTGCRLKWVSASLGHVPEGSIVAAYQRGGPKYYVARVKHDGLRILGKLQPEVRLAHVSYSGQELPFTSYETLVRFGSTRTTTTPTPVHLHTVTSTSVSSRIVEDAYDRRSHHHRDHYNS